jgi:uncharacterized protein (UPF0276 family)
VSAHLRVGLAYSAAAAHLIDALDSEIDFVEVPYELLVRDEVARAIAREAPAILHCASLSLASGALPSAATVARVAELADEIDSPWVGEHLALISASCPWGAGGPLGEPVYDVGFAVSPPMNEATVDSVVGALSMVTSCSDRPVLLENGPVYLTLPGNTMSQAEAMASIHQRSGAGILLDLAHHVITCRTLGLDPADEVLRLPLEHVREIHLSGMREEAGVTWDEHSSLPTALEYELLRIVLDRSPIEAITHEYNWPPVVDVELVREELARTRAIADDRARVGH